MDGLISLVNYNQMDKNLKEILVYGYLDLIVNNWPKNEKVTKGNENRSRSNSDDVLQLSFSDMVHLYRLMIYGSDEMQNGT